MSDEVDFEARMSTKCLYMKRDGSVCNMGYKNPHTMCAKHRIHPPAKPSGSCSSCGHLTSRRSLNDPDVYLCTKVECGRNEYRRAHQRRKRAGSDEVAPTPAAWLTLSATDQAAIVAYVLRGGYARVDLP